MSLLKKFQKSIRLFFTNPEPGGLKSLLYERRPDWDSLVRLYFGMTIKDDDPKYAAELKMRLMELEEQKKATQRNVEMLWRSQILTAITTVISLFIGVVALIK